MAIQLDLSGRVVLVCGAGSSGDGTSNGEAAVLAYAAAGAAVGVLDVRPAEAERVAAAVLAAGGTAVPVVADVTREDDVRDAVRAVRDALGSPDVLHNNVGGARVGDLADTDLGTWRAVVDLNLTSAFLTCKHVLPLMLERGRGVITNVSSVAGIRATGYRYPAYSSGKAGLNQLTVSLALAHAAQGIRANAILPGLIDTPMVAVQVTGSGAAASGAADRRHAASPTGRMGRPEDVAHLAVFLATDLAAYVNGVCIPVDGGLSARCL